MHTLTDNERLQLWLSLGTEYFVRQYRAVRARFPSLAEAFALAQKRRGDAFAFLPEHTVARLMENAQAGRMERFIEQLQSKRIDVVLDGEAGYPALLHEIPDAPTALYVRGRLPEAPALAIAVIGTRKPSDYGRDAARMFGHALAEAGALVVSGMASGIDAVAARGALDHPSDECATVAVLGTGVDVPYPPENRALYEEIVERGAVVSEFSPGTQARPQNFPIRNRIMSGLSHGVLVVEAGERSGTSITAGYAHDEGREVFAVPGRIFDSKSIGTNRMIRLGEAKPVCCVDDVLSEFEGFPTRAGQEKQIMPDYGALTPQQKAIVELLKTGERTVDELDEQLSLPMGQLNSVLTQLQFSGIIKQLPGRVYALDTMRAFIR